MLKIDEFKLWLDATTSYTKETKSNLVSRLKRANNILPVYNEPVYLFMLSQQEDFKVLSVTVRSQLRRAVKVYTQFLENEEVARNEYQ